MKDVLFVGLAIVLGILIIIGTVTCVLYPPWWALLIIQGALLLGFLIGLEVFNLLDPPR